MKYRQRLMTISFSLLFVLMINFSIHAEPFMMYFSAPWKDYSSYKEPTKRFLAMHSFPKIYQTLQSQKITLNHKSFYDIVMEQEEPGFIAYNASCHEFRVFQDIIRITLEEVLGLEFKKDFYFFRYPGDPDTKDYKSAHDFLKNTPNVNDNTYSQRNQLISANFSLYNNFDLKFECSVVFFELSRSFTPPKFESKIADFFREMGMSSFKIQSLFNIGKQVDHDKAGNLFQIFDLSHQDPFNKNAYEFVDNYVYPSIKKGEPLTTSEILSDLYQGSNSSQFLDQCRIVVNHKAFLNPYSSITIRRYDLNEPHVVKDYETKLRNAIKAIPYNQEKAKLYKQKLYQYWDMN